MICRPGIISGVLHALRRARRSAGSDRQAIEEASAHGRLAERPPRIGISGSADQDTRGNGTSSVGSIDAKALRPRTGSLKAIAGSCALEPCPVLATQLAGAQASLDDLSELHERAAAGANAARRAVEQNAYTLQRQTAERSKLLTELEAARMQERMAEALARIGSMAPAGNVPTLPQLQEKIDRRIGRGAGRLEVARDGVESQLIEVERAVIDTRGEKLITRSAGAKASAQTRRNEVNTRRPQGPDCASGMAGCSVGYSGPSGLGVRDCGAVAEHRDSAAAFTAGLTSFDSASPSCRRSPEPASLRASSFSPVSSDTSSCESRGLADGGIRRYCSRNSRSRVAVCTCDLGDRCALQLSRGRHWSSQAMWLMRITARRWVGRSRSARS